MWFLVQDNTIIDERHDLPSLWLDVDGVQRPIGEMAKKGHDISTCGWLPQIVIPTAVNEYTEVVSFSNAIVGNTVESTEVVGTKPTPALIQIKKTELESEYIRRIQLLDEDLTMEGIAVLSLLWPSIASAARQPTEDMTALIALHQSRKNIVAEFKALLQDINTTPTQIINYNILTNPLWTV